MGNMYKFHHTTLKIPFENQDEIHMFWLQCIGYNNMQKDNKLYYKGVLMPFHVCKNTKMYRDYVVNIYDTEYVIYKPHETGVKECKRHQLKGVQNVILLNNKILVVFQSHIQLHDYETLKLEWNCLCKCILSTTKNYILYKTHRDTIRYIHIQSKLNYVLPKKYEYLISNEEEDTVCVMYKNKAKLYDMKKHKIVKEYYHCGGHIVPMYQEGLLFIFQDRLVFESGGDDDDIYEYSYSMNGEYLFYKNKICECFYEEGEYYYNEIKVLKVENIT